MPKRLLLSFSFGETSAFMTKWMLDNKRHEYDEIKVVVANTGQENEESLVFGDLCDKHFGFDLVWVEAQINTSDRKNSSFKIVDFESADREGKVFEKMIQAYGIPNPDWLHCTRELKTRPITKYLRSIGWEAGSYDTAIGIRADEIDRINPNAKESRLLYPLITDIEMTKPRVNNFWRNQPFRLNLKGYQGNCKWCWKKSLRKHLTLISENPEQYDFPERMESIYSHINPESKKGDKHEDRVFFREKMSTKDLRKIAAKGGFAPASDDAQVYEDQQSFDFNLDENVGCHGSCEIDFTELD